MRGIDLVVPVSADQEKVPHLRLGDQALEQLKGRRVKPLQIVKEQRQRVLRPGERTEKPPKHQLKAVLRVLRSKLRNGRLFTDHELKLRNKVDDELTVPAQLFPQGAAPSLHLRFALGENL